MTWFRYMNGFVYILKNIEAKRVKIGMTINDVNGRLQDVNEKWLGIKATCQICGGRRLIDQNGNVPIHVLSGVHCRGSGALPFERDVILAKSYLGDLKMSLSRISGVELNSTVRRISTLERRVEQFRKFDRLVGTWRISTVYYTSRAEEVELKAHEVLANHLDDSVPIGEVFDCSVSTAVDAVERVLDRSGLLHSVRKEVVNT